MSAVTPLKGHPMPRGWVEVRDGGQLRYVNELTNESTAIRPTIFGQLAQENSMVNPLHEASGDGDGTYIEC